LLRRPVATFAADIRTGILSRKTLVREFASNANDTPGATRRAAAATWPKRRGQIDEVALDDEPVDVVGRLEWRGEKDQEDGWRE